MESFTRTCATAGCDERTAGESKYCRTHRTLAHAAWRQKVQQGTADRLARYEEFRRLVARAHEAGMLAGNAAVPVPMALVGGTPGGPQQVYIDNEGPCGFAWIHLKHSSLALWLKKNGIADKAYGGGYLIWVGEFGQSITRKEAYARAYAQVLRDAGHEHAHAQSRLD